MWTRRPVEPLSIFFTYFPTVYFDAEFLTTWRAKTTFAVAYFFSHFLFSNHCYVSGRTAFEKMTDVDYFGDIYYTIRNLSLYECQGWCREEPECQAASFSFAVNPMSGKQETTCLLQNATQANNPTAKPKREINQYYMVKMSIRSGKEALIYRRVFVRSFLLFRLTDIPRKDKKRQSTFPRARLQIDSSATTTPAWRIWNEWIPEKVTSADKSERHFFFLPLPSNLSIPPPPCVNSASCSNYEHCSLSSLSLSP